MSLQTRLRGHGGLLCVKRKHGDLGVFLDGRSQSLRETRLTGPLRFQPTAPPACLPAVLRLQAPGEGGMLWTPPVCGKCTWHVQWFLLMLVEVATALVNNFRQEVTLQTPESLCDP